MKPEDFHCFKVALLTGNPHHIDNAGMNVLMNRWRTDRLIGFSPYHDRDIMSTFELLDLFEEQAKRVYYYPARGCGKTLTLEKIEKLLKEVDINGKVV